MSQFGCVLTVFHLKGANDFFKVAIMGLDAYYNVVSQPSRTILMFLCKNDIEFNKKELDLFAKGKWL